MRAGVMSAGALGVVGLRREKQRQGILAEETVIHAASGWNKERFEQEQIRGLVRQVFSPRMSPPVRQLVLSGVEPETDVLSICRRVAEALSAETQGDVVVVTGQRRGSQMCGGVRHPETPIVDQRCSANVRQSATRVGRNLWLAPGKEEELSTASLHKYLAEVRAEFEYSIVAAPPAGESNEALAMAQFADGMILVLSANRTRPATARKVTDLLTQVRLLGTVLADREFPIPEGIYRRL